jgi:predicted dienelactone hydrolase
VPKSEIDLQLATLPSPKAHDNPPVSRSSPGGFPLVVFSHGLQTVRFQSYGLMEFLASHGYVVAAPDHTGNTIFDAMSGTPVDIPTTLRDRPRDVSAVIDEMLERNATGGDPFQGRIDGDRIAASGNSTGGWTALVMSTGYRDAAENTDVAPDPRVKATVAISPFLLFFPPGKVPSLKGPAMIIGGTSDELAPVERDSKRAFDLLPSNQRFRVDIHEAAHGSFSNVCDFKAAFDGAAEPVPANLTAFVDDLANQSCADGLRPPDEVQRITNLYTLSFLDWALNDDHRYEKYLSWGTAHRLPVDYFRGDQP